MAIRSVGIGIVLISLGLVAAGEGSPHEQIIQKTLGALDAITAELTKITDVHLARSRRGATSPT